jgi:hypothetical protein
MDNLEMQSEGSVRHCELRGIEKDGEDGHSGCGGTRFLPGF